MDNGLGFVAAMGEAIERWVSDAERGKRLAAAAAALLWLGCPVRVRPDPHRVAWCWGGVEGLRGNVVEITPVFIRVAIRRPKVAKGRIVNVSPLLLLALPSKRKVG